MAHDETLAMVLGEESAAPLVLIAAPEEPFEPAGMRARVLMIRLLSTKDLPDLTVDDAVAFGTRMLGLLEPEVVEPGFANELDMYMRGASDAAILDSLGKEVTYKNAQNLGERRNRFIHSLLASSDSAQLRGVLNKLIIDRLDSSNNETSHDDPDTETSSADVFVLPSAEHTEPTDSDESRPPKQHEVIILPSVTPDETTEIMRRLVMPQAHMDDDMPVTTEPTPQDADISENDGLMSRAQANARLIALQNDGHKSHLGGAIGLFELQQVYGLSRYHVEQVFSVLLRTGALRITEKLSRPMASGGKMTYYKADALDLMKPMLEKLAIERGNLV